MRIAGIAASFPSRVVTNDDIVAMITRHSEGGFDGDLPQAVRRIRHLLRYSGIETRRWLAAGEQPIQFLSDCVSQALREAGWKPKDIDVLVYVGVGGGFKEPGNAYMVAHALGLHSVQCFDLRDACMSWSRALQVLYHLFRSDPSYRRALLVNAEFNCHESDPRVAPHFALRDSAEIEWHLPAYTIGEAATATLLEADPTREWEFHFSSRPDLADLCTITEPGFEGFCTIGLEADAGAVTRSKIGRNGSIAFTSFGADLFATFSEEGPAVFRRLRCRFEDIRMVFPHAASKKLYEDVGRAVGSPPTYYVYPQYGNIVSASVPAGIALASQAGRIKPGDRLIGWVGSAGMSFAAYSFIY
jgi:3-oxoacyl-[acyl-carrier-protein] synthase III